MQIWVVGKKSTEWAKCKRSWMIERERFSKKKEEEKESERGQRK